MGEEAEGDDRGADDAGGGPEQHADGDDRDAHAARYPAEQVADDVDELLGQPGLLQHHAHEDEERDRPRR
jgi:hypothetical protein